MGCGSSKRISTPPPADHSKGIPSDNSMTISRVEDLKISSGTFIQFLRKPFSECYQMLRELGCGQFGKVYLAEHQVTGERRAVKVVHKRKSSGIAANNNFIGEVEILARLNHPNIIKIYEMFEDERKYYVVSELCTGGELFEYITQRGHLSETVAAEIMQQLLSAVNYCHENHIVHRDLKPENLLLDSVPIEGERLTIKLIDFGTSTLYSGDNKLKQKLGTAYYIAPEVLRMDYNEKCDVWSCGVILYILLCGAPPFTGKTDDEILENVKTGKFNFLQEEWRNISVEAKSLIKRMLVMDTGKRLSARECLEDHWIRQSVGTRMPEAEHVTLSLNQLKQFRAEQKLRDAFLTFMTSRMLTKEYEKELSDAFQAIDKNGDGKLSREELLEAYKLQMPLEEAQCTVESILTRVDADKNGFIDYSEFVLASTDYQSLLSQTNLQAAFDQFDKDGSGKISSTELKAMLGSHREVNDQVWTALIEQADQNGDGEIEFKEFCKLMLTAVGEVPLS